MLIPYPIAPRPMKPTLPGLLAANVASLPLVDCDGGGAEYMLNTSVADLEPLRVRENN